MASQGGWGLLCGEGAIVARDCATLDGARDRIAVHVPKARVLALQADACSAQQLITMHEQVLREFGRINVLVNNAGQATAAPFGEVTNVMWQADLDRKLMTSVRLTRLVWPGMVARRWGRVINVLNTHAKVLAHEGGPHNVPVNALIVGRIKSDQAVRRHRASGSALPLAEYMRQHAIDGRVPMGRMGEPEEFAGLVCFLASAAGGYINGVAINVDGGMAPVT